MAEPAVMPRHLLDSVPGLRQLALLLGVLVALLCRQVGTMAWLFLPILYFTLLPGPVGVHCGLTPASPASLLAMTCQQGLQRASLSR